MLRHNLLHLLLLVAVLSACGDSDSNPAAPVATPGTNESPTQTTPPDADAETAAETTEVLTERVAGLRSLRDLTFGPTDSGLDDELFVVHFEGVEATWVQAVDSTPVLRRFKNSLVGAIALDMDRNGRFYFACLTPVMDASRGVITVRTIGSQVADFQYTGVSEPSGVALDANGDLFVFNRGSCPQVTS